MNVSSSLAFVPLPISPVYCATKAGLHSFTESLRVQLKNTKVKVFDLAPPVTQTVWQHHKSRGDKRIDLFSILSEPTESLHGRICASFRETDDNSVDVG